MIERTDRFQGKVVAGTTPIIANRDTRPTNDAPKTVMMPLPETARVSEDARLPTYDTAAVYTAEKLGALVRRWLERTNAASHTGLVPVLGTLAARPEYEQPEFVFIHMGGDAGAAGMRMTYAVVPGLIYIDEHILAEAQAGKTTDVLVDTLARALTDYADGERGRMASAFRRLALTTNTNAFDT